MHSACVTLVTVTLLFLFVLLEQSHVVCNAAAAAPPRIKFSTLGMNVELQLMDWVSPTQLEMVLSSSDNSGDYYGIGFAHAAMTGHIIACLPPSAATPTTTCVDMRGEGYDADRVSSTTTLVSSNYSNGVGMVVLRATTATFGLSPSDGMRRVIFARGEWETDDNEAGDHGSTWSQSAVDVFTGKFQLGTTDTPNTYIALVCAWFASVAVAAVGAALKSVHQRQRRSVSLALRVVSWAFFAACFVAVIVVSLPEFKAMQNFAPIGRSFGAGACYLFSLVLLPTNKYLNVGYIAGASYDRFISYHVICGWAVYLTVSVHFFYMLAIANSPAGGNFIGICFNSEEGVQNTIVAFLGWLLMTFFFIVAAARSYSFYWFRVTHAVFPVFLVLFIIHYPPLGVCLAPGLLLTLIDFIMRYVTRNRDARIVEARVDKDSRVVKLVVGFDEAATKQRVRDAHAGQFVMFSISDISELVHPFTVAHRAEDGSQITLYIRGSGSFSNALVKMAETENSKLLASSFRAFIGPLGGSTEVDLDYPTDMVLVAGGIGVTATLGLLHTLVERVRAAPAAPADVNNSNAPVELRTPAERTPQSAAGGSPFSATEKSMPLAPAGNPALCADDGFTQSRVRSIKFVWCVREASLASFLMHHIAECSNKLATTAARSVGFSAKIFVTASSDGGSAAGGVLDSSAYSCIDISLGRRPGVKDLAPLENSTSCGGALAYFCCGPAPLMAAAREAAAAHNALIHEEVFDF